MRAERLSVMSGLWCTVRTVSGRWIRLSCSRVALGRESGESGEAVSDVRAAVSAGRAALHLHDARELDSPR